MSNSWILQAKHDIVHQLVSVREERAVYSGEFPTFSCRKAFKKIGRASKTLGPQKYLFLALVRFWAIVGHVADRLASFLTSCYTNSNLKTKE